MNTKQVGSLTELQCITRFYELGYTVSIPYGDSEKYDFILDVNGKLYKLQCKHCSEKKDSDGNTSVISIKTSWQSGYTKNEKWSRHLYTLQDIDYFVTHYNGKNYMIPVGECGTMKYLRLTNPLNNKQGVYYLRDYEDTVVCKNL